MNEQICGECGSKVDDMELIRCDECEVPVCYSCIHLTSEGEYRCDACYYDDEASMDISDE